jgi:excinuclease UvrABC nuclease subunit
MASRWESISLSERHLLPSLPGVYVLYLDKDIKYIGQSIDLHKRIHDHLGNETASKLRNLQNSSRVTVKFKVCFSPNEYLGLEVRLITRLRPEWNIALAVNGNWQVQCRRARYYKPGDFRRMLIRQPQSKGQGKYAAKNQFGKPKNSSYHPWRKYGAIEKRPLRDLNTF